MIDVGTDKNSMVGTWQYRHEPNMYYIGLESAKGTSITKTSNFTKTISFVNSTNIGKTVNRYFVIVTTTDWGSSYTNDTQHQLSAKVTNTATTHIIPTDDDITVVYNGKKQSIDKVADWYDSTLGMTFTELSKDTATKVAFVDAGKYTVTVNLPENNTGIGLSEDTRTADINITITKKKIGMYAPSVTDEGDLLAGYEYQITDPNLPYDRDIDRTGATPVFKDTAPEFGLEYRKDGSTAWTTTKPTTAGKYYARPYITNPTTSNYEIDYTLNNCETPFERLKNPVAVPYFTNSSVTAADIVGTVTTVQYTGDWQDFDLINDATTGTLIGVTTGARTGGLSYSTLTKKFRARNVGEYTVTVYLADNGSNTRWADSTSNPATTRVITLKITKRELKVTFADETITSWSKGERTDIKINVTGVIPGEKVKL
ncbi:MAG: hypothetical protein K2N74_02955, partial [Clostridiales bacterium]|nr:hypothetical protein [Clostridiales bacterium]